MGRFAPLLMLFLLAGMGSALAQGRGLGPPAGVVIGPPMGIPVAPPVPPAVPTPPQVPPGLGGIPPGLSGTAPGLAGTAPGLSGTAPGQLVRDTVQTARDAVGRPENGGSGLASPLLALDGQGRMIVSSEVVAVSPTPQSLAVARRLRFTIERQETLDGLGLSVTTLKAPQGMGTVEALAELRSADPLGNFDYDHVYNPSGGNGVTTTEPATPMPDVHGLRVGMIDGGVDSAHPAFRQAAIVAREFAGTGQSPATLHGTAVASLLVGRDTDFSGYLPGARLYAADVYGGAADGGSAADIARALNWMSGNGIAVTNISLAGPPNALLAAAVKAFLASGHLLVAAAGNNGPAAGPSYPAAYPGVVAVTSVDSSKRFEIDASREPAQFAALGVNVRVASSAGGYTSMSGTSLAAPAVSARFAMLLDSPDVANRNIALAELSKAATPLEADNDAPRYVGAPILGDAPASFHGGLNASMRLEN
jgi:Subtilase family